ncbi:MAG: hypothetical protein N2449_10005, partial [Bacteroidales bacterium]|nr:hypothetical protein [Bacteroidales bacterium]
MKKVFLLILAAGIVFTACNKEEKLNGKQLKEMTQLKKAPKKPTPPRDGRTLYLNLDKCDSPPEACAPYDIVVTPDGTTIKSYMNFLTSIANGREHEFFANTTEVKILFPFLLEDEWKEFYQLCLDETMKFIEWKNTETNKNFYFLV